MHAMAVLGYNPRSCFRDCNGSLDSVYKNVIAGMLWKFRPAVIASKSS